MTSLMTSSKMESSLLIILLVAAAGRCQGNVVATATGGDSFFPEWGLGGGRSAQPTCVDIPRNLTLCYGIRYSKMRLPNLLDHDSMAEVIQQAASWVPLLNVRCHADTQLFLCSLFRSLFLSSLFLASYKQIIIFLPLAHCHSLRYTPFLPHCYWIIFLSINSYS